MPEFCTCGTPLVEGARFCHKCGRPVRDEAPPVEPETSAPPAPPPVLTQEAQPEIGFHDRTAVRIGFLVAALALLLGSFPIAPWLPLLGMLVGGAVSVYWYNRRTGRCLSVRAGMRMGWMTGVFGFLLSMVLMTLALALAAGQGEALQRALREQAGFSEEMIQRASEVLRSPAELLLSLLMGFLTFSLTAALGGALGARVFHKD